MVVDLAVPFSPFMRTPPIPGSITFRIRAFFIRSWPTIAANGNIIACLLAIFITFGFR